MLTGTGSETHFHNEIMMVMGDGCVSATGLNARLNINENCNDFRNIS